MGLRLCSGLRLCEGRACHDFFFSPRTHRSLRERPFPRPPLARFASKLSRRTGIESWTLASLRPTRTASKFSADERTDTLLSAAGLYPPTVFS